jgi:hypothetical protein
MPIGWESCFDQFVGKVLEFAVQDTFRFVHSVLRIPRRFDFRLPFDLAQGWRPLSAKRFEQESGRVLSAPLCIGFRLRRNSFLQPRFQRAILPVVGRVLFANQSHLHSQGIAHTKCQPARAECLIERVQVAKVVEHVIPLPVFISWVTAQHAVTEPHGGTAESRSAAAPGK